GVRREVGRTLDATGEVLGEREERRPFDALLLGVAVGGRGALADLVGRGDRTGGWRAGLAGGVGLPGLAHGRRLRRPPPGGGGLQLGVEGGGELEREDLHSNTRRESNTDRRRLSTAPVARHYRSPIGSPGQREGVAWASTTRAGWTAGSARSWDRGCRSSP